MPDQGNSTVSAPRTGLPGRLETRICWARRVISSAARRVNVNSNKRRGSAPPRISRATRCASVLVLPVPAPAAINSGGSGPSVRTDAIGSSAALRRVQPLQKRVDGGRSSRSVPFPFHTSPITSAVRRRNPARSRQAKASVPAITDRGRGRSETRIGRSTLIAAPAATRGHPAARHGRRSRRDGLPARGLPPRIPSMPPSLAGIPSSAAISPRLGRAEAPKPASMSQRLSCDASHRRCNRRAELATKWRSRRDRPGCRGAGRHPRR